jgi:hypothetical protein
MRNDVIRNREKSYQKVFFPHKSYYSRSLNFFVPIPVTNFEQEPFVKATLVSFL